MRKSSAKAAIGGSAWPRYALAACLATSALIVTANTISMQDVGELTGVDEKSADRWAMSIKSVPVGSVARKSQHRLQGSQGVSVEETLAVKAADKARIIRDIAPEKPVEKINLNRSLKGDRVVGIPPRYFETSRATPVLLQSQSLFAANGSNRKPSFKYTLKMQETIGSFAKESAQFDIAVSNNVRSQKSRDAVLNRRVSINTGGVPVVAQTAKRVSFPIVEQIIASVHKQEVTIQTAIVSSSGEAPAAVQIRKSIMAAIVPRLEKPKVALKVVPKPKPAKRMIVGSIKPNGAKPKKPDPMLAEVGAKTEVSLVTAYAPQAAEKESPFDAVLRPTLPKGRPASGGIKKALSKLKIKLGKRDHKWALNPLPKNSYGAAQRRCLATGIYFEARGEPVKGQQAVAQVILNRVKNPAYPRTICSVVYQNKRKRNRCQFSFACDGIRDRIRSQKHWRVARKVANDAIDGKVWLRKVGSASHYHADYVRPRWRRSMKRRVKIGRHIFYRTYGGGWT